MLCFFVLQRSNAIPPHLQVLTALRFYATGSFYTVHGDLHTVSVPSVCRIVHQVTQAFCRLANRVIRFPANLQDEVQTKRDFFDVAGFPDVLGAIGCSHIRLYGAPLGENEHLYVNRKGYHSINTQVICNANFRITNVDGLAVPMTVRLFTAV